MKKLIYPIIFIFVVFIFFWKFFIHGLLPIPSDTIGGLYHPWRDLYVQQYPSGIPFKNFLITDPVRQQYPWRELAISLLKRGQLPLWNPYTHAGTPLLANLQSAVFYPLNILFVLPFNMGWSFLVTLQPLLAGLFLYFYLRHFNLRKEASLLGALSYSFSGFFIVWLEWNTLLHVALWLPLILLSLEKLFLPKSITILQSMGNKWFWIFVFSLSSALFAGHLQVFFYVFLISLIYAGMRIFSLSKKERGKAILLFVFCYLLFAVVASIQWLPILKFISLSAREFDQADWQREGWFIPWPHLIQFFAPDFFGNPTTLNYWGVWNYGEMIGYIGILPLIMALFAMIYRHDKKTLFFGSMFFLSLIFATPTWFAKLPYRLQIPLISTSQPTRLLFLIDFSLAVLAALGFDYFLRKKGKVVQTIKLLSSIGLIYGLLWIFVFAGTAWFPSYEGLIDPAIALPIAKRNLILPTGLFVGLGVLLFLPTLFKDKKIKKVFVFCSLFFVVFDLLRFGWKFTPFTKEEYLFPSTWLIEFLQRQPGPFRIMATDKRILPPNFSVVYRLQTVDGYDPLYLRDYGELVAAWQREKPDISPFSFNRILTPQNYESRIADLLNVKYVLSLDELKSEKLVKVFEEGQTKIYENKDVFPRAFLVESVIKVDNKQEAIEKIFDKNVDLRRNAIVYDEVNISNRPLDVDENVKVVEYRENMLKLKVKAGDRRLLVLTDNYYPNWNVFVDGEEEKIYKVNYTFRGVTVPEGRHEVIFTYHFL